MNQSPTKQRFSQADKIKIIVVSIFLAILLVIFGFLMGLLLRQSGFRLSTLVERLPAMPNIQIPSTGPTAVIPTAFIPTQDCGEPTLVLGTTTFKIKNLTLAAKGSLTIPSGTSGIAYWIEGTNSNYVFLLPPTPENLAAMDAITVGSPATVTWSDCSLTSYNLSTHQQGSFNTSTLLDQSQEGITVFFQIDPSGIGFVFTGGLIEQEITTINTPNPNEIQAEIGLLETIASTDGKTIKIGISINNYGTSSITLAASDISLTQPDGTPLALKSSKPHLPEGVRSGQTKNFELTFLRPDSSTSTLKIFTVEYDIEGY